MRLIWSYDAGLAYRRVFSARHQYLLWLANSDRPYFDLDAVRVPSVYPLTVARGRVRGNPLGKNPGSVWRVAKVTSGRSETERVPHPAQMPLELAQRMVRATTPCVPEAVCLDPFAGSGTTLVAAAHERISSFGIERDEQYALIALARLRRRESVPSAPDNA